MAKADATLDPLQDALARWEREVLRPALEKQAERRPRFETSWGGDVARLYTALDAPAPYDEALGFPGEPPFTRGVQPTMYRGRHWTMRQYAGFGTAAETNRRFRLLLDGGQTGLSVAFDLPTQMGRDSDHAIARGEVGKVGVAIDSLDDMQVLLDGIPLDRVSTSMTINATAAILLCLYVAVGEAQGVARAKLTGTIQNDILKEYIARGTYIYPPAPSMRLITDIFAWSSRELPRFNTISISGYHIREAGSTSVQEVAFTLGDGIAYVEAALHAGLRVDAFAPRLSFFFNAHNGLVEEVAKYRAARRLWSRIMRERFGSKDARSMALRFHAQTAGSSLTAQQPEVNIVRTALQALSAVLGGAQSVHTNSMDEALGLPTEHAALLALRTQQVIAYESGVADTVDPLGGAYAVEALTDRIEAGASEYLRQIDELGGMVHAIEEGFPQKEILDAAYRTQRAIEAGEQVVVGVNKFGEGAGGQKASVPVMRIDEAGERRQIERVRDVRARRDATRAQAALKAITAAARGTDNLMPHILEAVKALCTVGEISDAMREVFGAHRENVVL